MTIIGLSNFKIKINLFFFLSLVIFFLYGYTYYAVISFSIVIIHELSHTLAANLLGYKPREIELFPLGGVLRLDRLLGENPKDEIIISICGPISNLIMAIVAYFYIVKYNINRELLFYFIYANIIITIVNLLPILPLDGGRIGRAYLSYFIGMKRATKIFIRLSRVFALLIFCLGLFLSQINKLNIVVSFLAIFIYIALRNEREMAVFIFMKEVMGKKQKLFQKDILRTRQLIAMKNTSLKKVINMFQPQKYHIINVMDYKGRVVGILTENQIIDGIEKYGLNTNLEILLIDIKRC